MKCEEFEWMALDADRETTRGGVDGQAWAAAMEHANGCTRCAALLRSWRAARVELQLLRAATQDAETPARVEMRLRNAVGSQGNAPGRKLAMISACTLAMAVVLLALVSWRSWREERKPLEKVTLPIATRNPGIPNVQEPSVPGVKSAGQKPSVEQRATQDTDSADDLNEFTFLPGSVPVESGDSEIFRVRLQRGALAALGLPVNEERAAEWLQVDLLVTEDGQPQAVRLVR